MTKVFVIGLDCADPKLVFEQFWDDLPNIRRICEKGSYGPLRSVTPPITVPAWMSMVTGKDPGELGIYGFRNRMDHSYTNVGFAHSGMLKAEPIWQTLSKKGNPSILLGVPMTYPPKALKGIMVTGFLTPSTDYSFTWPPELKDEVLQLIPDYQFDVDDFRTDDKARLLKDLYSYTDKQFHLARHLAGTKKWDFFMMVNIGPDRLHHAMWAYHDTTHPKHDPQSPFKTALRDYYIYLDKKIGELREILPEDTVILIVSDHGVQKMNGGIALNDWLIRNGYLTLKIRPQKPVRLGKLINEDLVDWKNTIAWAWGGYSGKLFLNVRGREPEGIVPPGKISFVLEKLKKEIGMISGENGEVLDNQILEPGAIYKETQGYPPDLIVQFDNLSWRVLGSVGNSSLWVHENDTGPDDANHAMEGIFISSSKIVNPISLRDIRDLVKGSITEDVR